MKQGKQTLTQQIEQLQQRQRDKYGFSSSDLFAASLAEGVNAQPNLIAGFGVQLMSARILAEAKRRDVPEPLGAAAHSMPLSETDSPPADCPAHRQRMARLRSLSGY